MISGVASYFYVDVSGQILTTDSYDYFIGGSYTTSRGLSIESKSAKVTSDKIFGSGFSLYLVYDSSEGWFDITDLDLNLTVYYF